MRSPDTATARLRALSNTPMMSQETATARQKAPHGVVLSTSPVHSYKSKALRTTPSVHKPKVETNLDESPVVQQ